MAETDILNPVQGFSDELGFNPNWSYGSPRRTTSNTAATKARLGLPFSRDVMNQGYAFELYFIDNPWAAIQRIVWFYNTFKNGYFTIIDWDGGGRHHVGRFTSAPNAQETANGKYTIQGLLFEETPTARMLMYPWDWANWSHPIYAIDDYLNPRVAYVGPWVAQVSPLYLAAPILDTSLSGGTILQVDFQGQQLFPVGSQVVLNGLTIATGLNGYTGTVHSSTPGQVIIGYLNGPAIPGLNGLHTDTGTIAQVGLPAAGPANYEMIDLNAAAGDMAQVQYVGWGFQIVFRLAANLGICNIELDGAVVVPGLDLSTGLANIAAPPVPGLLIQISTARGVSYATVSVPDVPLNIHRVAVVATGTKNANATATTIIFPPVQVMH